VLEQDHLERPARSDLWWLLAAAAAARRVEAAWLQVVRAELERLAHS
jgi:hypothetical protein